MLTKESIVKLLQENDRAVARALVVLTARQTADEQASEQTRYLNGRGYRPCHARMGVSMSRFFERHGYLSPKQIAYWRARDKTGAMRIGIYAGQLLEVAQEKAAKPKVALGDVGNLCEEKLAIEEQLDAYNEGAMGEGPLQDAAVERLHNRLIQIRDELEEINRY